MKLLPISSLVFPGGVSNTRLTSYPPKKTKYPGISRANVGTRPRNKPCGPSVCKICRVNDHGPLPDIQPWQCKITTSHCQTSIITIRNPSMGCISSMNKGQPIYRPGISCSYWQDNFDTVGFQFKSYKKCLKKFHRTKRQSAANYDIQSDLKKDKALEQ